MRRIAVFAFWFGALPEYFDGWLRSALANNSIDFYICTDHPLENIKNVRFIYMTEEEREALFSDVLGYPVSINLPVQVCNLLPMIGHVFEKELKNYDFWGYCEFDMAFGDLRSFLTDDMLSRYDRIYPLGHFTLFKNNERMRYLYKAKGSIYELEDVCNGDAPAGFVEYLGIDRICRINRISWYVKEEDFVDCYATDRPFRIMFGPESHLDQVFYWENGKLFQAWYEEGEIPHMHELAYLHWQQKIPILYNQSALDIGFFITTNGLVEKSQQGMPSIEECKKYGADVNKQDIQLNSQNKAIFFGKMLRRKFKAYFNRDNKGRKYMRKFYFYALFGNNPSYSDPKKYLFHS